MAVDKSWQYEAVTEVDLSTGTINPAIAYLDHAAGGDHDGLLPCYTPVGRVRHQSANVNYRLICVRFATALRLRWRQSTKCPQPHRSPKRSIARTKSLAEVVGLKEATEEFRDALSERLIFPFPFGHREHSLKSFCTVSLTRNRLCIAEAVSIRYLPVLNRVQLRFSCGSYSGEMVPYVNRRSIVAAAG